MRKAKTTTTQMEKTTKAKSSKVGNGLTVSRACIKRLVAIIFELLARLTTSTCMKHQTIDHFLISSLNGLAVDAGVPLKRVQRHQYFASKGAFVGHCEAHFIIINTYK